MAVANPERLPAFIIAGAMKSGTSTLHDLLASDDRLFLPPGEIFFFDIDDIEQHPDFGHRRDGSWRPYDFEKELEQHLVWYRRFFEPARADQILGERSTTYLSSRLAPARIASTLSSPRIIVMLRDPVARAYSHYWHLVEKGHATWSFEEAIRTDAYGVLSRGLYREQVERYLRHFARDRIRFILFEDFVRDLPSEVAATQRFLGLPERAVVAGEQHSNVTRRPRNMRVQWLLNRTFLASTERRYSAEHLPDAAVGGARRRLLALRRVAMKLNRSRAGYPPIDPATRQWLAAWYARANDGLAQLLDMDVDARWASRTRAAR